MSPEIAGLIILESLKLANHIVEAIPLAQRQAWWEEHDRRMAPFRDFLGQLRVATTTPAAAVAAKP